MSISESVRAKASPLALLRESLVYGVGIVLSRGLNVLLTPLLARTFSPREFGILDFFQVGTSVGVTVLSMRMESALLRYYPQAVDRGAMLFTYLAAQLAAGGVFLALVAVLGLPIAHAFGIDGPFTLLAAALTVPTTTLYTHALTVVRVRRDVTEASTWIFLNTAVNVAAVAAAVLVLRWGLFGVFLGKAIADGGVAAIIVLRNRHHYRRQFCWEILQRFLRFGVPLAPDEFLTLGRAHAAKFFLASFASLGDVGLLGVATRLAQVMNLCMSAFRQAWGPYAMSISDREDADRSYAAVFRMYVIGSLFALFAYVLFSREIVLILAGPAYLEVRWLLGLVAAIGVVGNLAYMFNLGLLLRDKTVRYLVAAVASTLVAVGSAWYLIGAFGLVGAPLSGLLASATLVLLVLRLAQWERPMPYSMSLLGLFFVALAALAAVGATDLMEAPLGARIVTFLAVTAAGGLGVMRSLGGAHEAPARRVG